MEGDFVTPFGEALTTVHEMFLSAMAAGFTQDQALRLMAYYLAEIGSRGEPESKGN